ncbi:MAG: PHP domain-containing protein, partial [Gammaproteobacteria bacterium]|nr:PHP domain-containing protein [Gammaproteobacteria bacterium]
MLIDFHTHTAASDGALSPRDLVALARERKLAMLAITDHDTVAGYLAVAEQGPEYTQDPAGLRLIPGVELSCRWSA